MIDISKERFDCTEQLFSRSLSPGIQDLVMQTISKMDKNSHAALQNNIVLSGGNSALKNFDCRLAKELRKMEPSTQFHIYTTKNPHIAAWCGGAMTASLSTFHQQTITRAAYNEYGINVLLPK